MKKCFFILTLMAAGIACSAQTDMVNESRKAAQQAKAGQTAEASGTAKKAMQQGTFTTSSPGSSNLANAIKNEVEKQLSSGGNTPSNDNTSSNNSSSGNATDTKTSTPNTSESTPSTSSDKKK